MFRLASGRVTTARRPSAKGLEKAREVYGAGGYFEFTGYPDYKFRDQPNPAEPDAPAALEAEAPAARTGPPIVDVAMRMQEGKQFFVNRITFTGNTTTRDNVIRREVRLVEDGVFNTEALKYSIKRLNQLGYFKPLEGTKDVDVQKTPGADNKVDVKLKLEEQNRNQLTFGAGVSEFEGFFGQLSFSTSNFHGSRREPHVVGAIGIARAATTSSRSPSRSCSIATSPAGSSSSSADIRYVGQFTQESTGGVITFGYPARHRLHAHVHELQLRAGPRHRDQRRLHRSARAGPQPVSARLAARSDKAGSGLSARSCRVIVHNTGRQSDYADHRPALHARRSIWPGSAETRTSTSPTVEGVWYCRQNSRMSLGFRAQFEYIHSFHGANELPIFEKLFLGWRLQRPRVRPPDDRAPDPTTGLVLGGNKSVLLQHRGADQYRRPRATGPLLRCGPGAGRARESSARRRSRRTGEFFGAIAAAGPELHV